MIAAEQVNQSVTPDKKYVRVGFWGRQGKGKFQNTSGLQ